MCYLSAWVRRLALSGEGTLAVGHGRGDWRLRRPAEGRAVGGSAGSSEMRGLWSPNLSGSTEAGKPLCASVGGPPSSMWSAVIGRGDLAGLADWGSEEEQYSASPHWGTSGGVERRGEGRGVGLVCVPSASVISLKWFRLPAAHCEGDVLGSLGEACSSGASCPQSHWWFSVRVWRESCGDPCSSPREGCLSPWGCGLTPVLFSVPAPQSRGQTGHHAVQVLT